MDETAAAAPAFSARRPATWPCAAMLLIGLILEGPDLASTVVDPDGAAVAWLGAVAQTALLLTAGWLLLRGHLHPKVAVAAILAGRLLASDVAVRINSATIDSLLTAPFRHLDDRVSRRGLARGGHRHRAVAAACPGGASCGPPSWTASAGALSLRPVEPPARRHWPPPRRPRHHGSPRQCVGVTVPPGFTVPEPVDVGVPATAEPMTVAIGAGTASGLLAPLGATLIAAVSSGAQYQAPEHVPAGDAPVDCALFPCVALTYDDGPSDLTPGAALEAQTGRPVTMFRPHYGEYGGAVLAGVGLPAIGERMPACLAWRSARRRPLSWSAPLSQVRRGHRM